jgi:5'-deoxynucleotidase YfbR-like HD superfamily hydrolase
VTVTAEQIETSSRLAGEVRRYHTWPVLREQSVASHSWQCLRIHLEIWGPPEPEVFTWILLHDSPEIVTGDPPFGAKGYMSQEQRSALADVEHGALLDQYATDRHEIVDAAHHLSEEQRRRAKICDLIDMLEFGNLELAMGNTLGGPIVTRVGHALDQQIIRLPGDAERGAVHDYLRRTGART